MMQDSRHLLLDLNVRERTDRGATCGLDTEGHCVTCSDEALPVKIVSIDQASGLALVEVQNVIEEIDITLVDDVTVGDIVLVHGGVAIGHSDEAYNEADDGADNNEQ